MNLLKCFRSALWVHLSVLRLKTLENFRLVFFAKNMYFTMEELMQILIFNSKENLKLCLRDLFSVEKDFPDPLSFGVLAIKKIDPENLDTHWYDDGSQNV